MGPLVYPHYHFLTMVVDTGGGLEHKNSFLGMTQPVHRRGRIAPTWAGWACRARVLPQLERQAPAAGRARAVRLRERELREDAVGRRRLHRLLRRRAAEARRHLRPSDEFLDGAVGPDRTGADASRAAW